MIVPLGKPEPDIDWFLDVVAGRKPISGRPPLVEYIIDDAVMKPILECLGRKWVPPGESGYWDNFVECWYRPGYDFVRYETAPWYANVSRSGKDTSTVSGRRSWAETGQGPIQTWQDFEVYPWPEVSDALFRPFEEISKRLPEGMGLIACHAAGIFEHVSQLFGYETLCFKLYDDPPLVEAVCQAVGSRMVRFYEKLLQFDRLVVVFQGDDMGHRSGTLVSPEHLRQYFLLWHQRFAQMAHARGLPYYLHSCGNVLSIMDELIEDVGIDAKHSFEDAILPAAEFYRRYHDRIATLGGVDLNVLAKGKTEDVRRATRELIDSCKPFGRFALGSGNSIPSYVPVQNYLTMLDEALREA